MTTELNIDPETPSSAQSRFGMFGNSAFMVILVATSLSSVGLTMYDTASAWLMTSLNPSPRMVSAVQVATTLPFFLLTLPAGALTDVVDPRRLLIVAQSVIVAISIAFAAVVSAKLASPPSLLGDIVPARGGRRAHCAGMAPHYPVSRAEVGTRLRNRDRQCEL